MIKPSRLVLALAVSTLAVLTAASGTSVAAPQNRVHGFHEFQSPSGNIGCEIVKSIARCDIKSHEWTAPKAPKSCHLDYGQGLQVFRRHKGDFTCAGDTVLNPKAPVLAYGHSISVASMRCVSKTTGVVCKNRKTKHGFAISKESYRRF